MRNSLLTIHAIKCKLPKYSYTIYSEGGSLLRRPKETSTLRLRIGIDPGAPGPPRAKRRHRRMAWNGGSRRVNERCTEKAQTRSAWRRRAEHHLRLLKEPSLCLKEQRTAFLVHCLHCYLHILASSTLLHRASIRNTSPRLHRRLVGGCHPERPCLVEAIATLTSTLTW